MGFFKNAWRFLFNFSEGQAEGRMFERMIRVALAETHTEQEFLDLMHHMLKQEDYLKTEVRWTYFLMRMGEYAHFQDHDWRVCANRLLADLPKRYGYAPKAAPVSQLSLPPGTEPPAF